MLLPFAHRAAPYASVIDDAMPTCPLCGRPIPPGGGSLHHLTPRLKGGKDGPTVLLHEICHKEIHAVFTEAELARRFNTVAALKACPRIARFVDWVSKRPHAFRSKVPGRRRRR